MSISSSEYQSSTSVEISVIVLDTERPRLARIQAWYNQTHYLSAPVDSCLTDRVRFSVGANGADSSDGWGIFKSIERARGGRPQEDRPDVRGDPNCQREVAMIQVRLGPVAAFSGVTSGFRWGWLFIIIALFDRSTTFAAGKNQARGGNPHVTRGADKRCSAAIGGREGIGRYAAACGSPVCCGNAGDPLHFG